MIDIAIGRHRTSKKWANKQILWNDLVNRCRETHRTSESMIEYLAAPFFVPGVALSDHFSFWRQGYSAIMVTDTAFYRNSWYHTAGDRPDRLQYESFAAVVQGLYLALLDCANDVS